MTRLLAVAAVFAVVCGPVAAQPKAVAQFKDWSVFVREVDGDRVCFAATEAKSKAPASVNHGDVFFLIATWKSGAATNQPSFMAGYTLKDQPAPVVSIGKQRFTMYASDNEGFIEQAADEQALIAALKRGSDMRVTATSSRGTATNYVLSLNGASAAVDRVRDACK
ncbi:MAG: invasion associated locus B family protein [Parvularculaceae bacterium]|nr:invasion associated locus B family protein [Parvularculaceae bacterium]